MSQVVQLDTNSADLSGNLTNSVDKATANIGDVLTYTISFKNIGTLAANNVLFMNTTPTGTVFLNNSLVVDGVIDVNNDTNLSPQSALNLGNIAVNYCKTISFKVAVTTIPSTFRITNIGTLNYQYVPGTGLATISNTINTQVATTTINYISIPVINSSMITATYTLYPTVANGKSIITDTNYVLTEINTATIVTSKICNSEFSKIGDVLTYTIPFKNVGNVSATNVIISDTTPNGVTILNETMKLDGTSTNINLNPPGYTFGTIPSGEAHTITYNALISTTPNPIGVKNSSTIKWNFTCDPSVVNGRYFDVNTNITVTTINCPFINTSKYVDKRYATWNEILTYTIRLQNSGTTIANGVVYKDTVPNGTSYVTGSLTINGTASGNAITNIQVGNLDVNAVTTIIFKVKVL